MKNIMIYTAFEADLSGLGNFIGNYIDYNTLINKVNEYYETVVWFHDDHLVDQKYMEKYFNESGNNSIWIAEGRGKTMIVFYSALE